MSKQNLDSMEGKHDIKDENEDQQQILGKDDENVEVVDTKPNIAISCKEQMMKIFEDLPDEESPPHFKEMKLRPKRSSLKRKQGPNKTNEPTHQSNITQKRQNILKLIDPYVRKYKATNAPSAMDSELNKLKYDGKEKIFKYMLYNVHQLKDIYIKDLSEQEKQIFNMNSIDAYNHAKSIANSISVYFVSSLNQNNKSVPSKKFKTQWKKVISNIQDENNFEFRIKIATKKWTPEKLAEADQIEFYPQAKRELINQRNKRLINASTVEDKFIQPVDELQNYETKFEVGEKNIQQKVNRSKSEYIEESTVKMLKQFLSTDHAVKMKESIDKDIKRNDKLLNNMRSVFGIE